jgi:ribose 5-phosphate isomerase B
LAPPRLVVETWGQAFAQDRDVVESAKPGGEPAFMSDKPIAIASDHAGYALKSLIAEELTRLGVQPLDLGTHDEESVDYPDFGREMGAAIESGRAERGVIVCGTGIGISIAANRNTAVRAALCHDSTSARLARQHNDANVLALGARLVGSEVAKDCLRVFLETPFEGGRHRRRVDKLG